MLKRKRSVTCYASKMLTALTTGSLLFTACSEEQRTDVAAKAQQGLQTYAVLSQNGKSTAIAAFQFVVSQEGTTIADRIVPLIGDNLPQHLADRFGVDGPFSDRYFVLSPGSYRASAIPLDSADEPVEACSVEEKDFEVFPGVTTEFLLTTTCKADPTGGADIIAVYINNGPVITDLEFAHSKFVDTCEDLQVMVTASDDDGDPLTFTWERIQEPAGTTVQETAVGATLTFRTDTPGPYEYRVTACDPQGACFSLVFPIHVSLGEDSDCLTQP